MTRIITWTFSCAWHIGHILPCDALHNVCCSILYTRGPVLKIRQRILLNIFEQIYFFFSLALQPSAGYGLLVSRGFLITHKDASQSVGLPCTSDQHVTETSTWQHTPKTNFQAPDGIKTHDRSRRAAVDPRHRTRDNWDRRTDILLFQISFWILRPYPKEYFCS
jgi:hypothetical protein